jgi:hypothetical protein
LLLGQTPGQHGRGGFASAWGPSMSVSAHLREAEEIAVGALGRWWRR